MRRFLFTGLVLLAAILLQVIVVNGLALPGGSDPDLVLVTVAALAVTSGPVEGALIGFCAGLALDVAPPAVGLIGQQALVFCLVGYAAGRLAGPLAETGWLRLAVVAGAAAAGEALQGAIGLMFSEPDLTWAAMRQVLPPVVVYECLLSPFVLAAVAALRERAGAVPDSGSVMGGELAARTKAAAAPLAAVAGATGSVRSTGTGRTPRLRPRSGRVAGGWIGSQPPPVAAHRSGVPQRTRQLRLRGGQAGSAAATPVTRSLPGRPVNLRLGSGRRGDRIPGAAAAVGALAAPHALLPGARPRGGSFSGGPSALRQRGTGILPGARPRAGSFGGGPSALRQRGAGFLAGARPRAGTFSGGPSAARRPGLLPGARPRKGTFSGGPSAARGKVPGLAGRGPKLRIGARRRRDGVVGGSIAGMLGRRRGMRAGRIATPRFRPGGSGGRRGGLGGGGLGGGLPGTRMRGRRLRLGSAGRRSRVWRIGGKRRGGL